MPASEFTILPPLAFIADCLKEARHAKKRIFLQAMDIEEGELANHFLSIVDKGTTDHLDTRVHVDHYSFMNWLHHAPWAKRFRVVFSEE